MSIQSSIPIYEMTLAAYLQVRHERYISSIQSALVTTQAELATCKGSGTRRRNQLNLNALACLRTLDNPQLTFESRKASYEREYKQRLLKALRTGQPISQHLIDQNSDLVKAQTAYARYLKARATSFDNLKNASVFDGKAGYKVKRQCGKPVEQSHLDHIETGMSEIEQALTALGFDHRLRGVFQQVGLTVAHTDNKRPFLRAKAAGLYTIKERCISIGTVIGGKPIRALAHEIGHMLAYEAGYALLGNERSWIEHHNRTAGPVRAMLTQASYALNSYFQINSLFKTKTKYATPESETEASRLRVRLGSYWREPDEIWARLFEQRIAGALKDPQIACEAEYAHTMAYWPADKFAGYVAAFDAALAQQFEILATVAENVSMRPPL